MARVGAFLDKWLGRASGLYGLWPILPSGVLAVLSAYFSTSVAAIAALGPWGWLSSGLATFLVSATAFALLARARLWRVYARERARLIGDSSPFDPMARVYENKRLYLRDLAPAGRRIVSDKKFIGCEIIGPGTVVLGSRSSESRPWPKMEACHTFDVDCIQIARNPRSMLAVEFIDCDFEHCKFFHMSLLSVERSNDTLHWITPRFDEPFLITDERTDGI